MAGDHRPVQRQGVPAGTDVPFMDAVVQAMRAAPDREPPQD
jgi:hypothetical protein